MKNIENLYLDGDPEQVPPAETNNPTHEPIVEEAIRALKAVEYQISGSNPHDDFVEGLYEHREQVREFLDQKGIDWRNL